MSFSEESEFVIHNWSTIEKLLSSISVARTELNNLALNLENELANRDWWTDDLVFNSKGLYISNKKWQVDAFYRVWIGVEGFTIEGLFGNNYPAQCYLWVGGSENKDQVISDLREIVTHKSHLEKYCDSKSSSYVLKKTLPKLTGIADARLSTLIEDDVANFIEDTYIAIKDYKLPTV